MNLDMSKVIVREATEEDYEGVMKILPHVYGGRDYMPACYPDMVKDTKRFLTLAEAKGEIIGFEMHYVVDDDQVIIREAGRIKEEYREKGLSKRLLQYGLSNVHQQYPAVKSLSLTTEEEGEILKLQYKSLLEKCFYRHLLRIHLDKNNILRSAVASPEFEHLCKGFTVGQTKLLLPSEALHTLDTLIDNTNILTDYAWLVNYEPFKPLHSNHVTITHKNTRGMPTVMVTKENRDDVTALSFGTVTPIRKGVMFRIDFYCHKEITEKRSGQLLQEHVAKHFLLFNQLRGDFMLVALIVFLPKEMSTEVVFELLGHVGVTDYEVVEKQCRGYCAEVNINSLITPNL